MKVKGMMKKTTVAALAVVIAAGASGFAAAPASAGTLQGAVSASQEAEAASNERVLAYGQITSLIFYNKIWLNSSGHTFIGNGGGGMTPGGGALVGEIYTDDLPRLFRDTVFYQVNATPVYTNIKFFGSSSNLLGHMHTGTIGLVAGFGDGTGYWT